MFVVVRKVVHQDIIFGEVIMQECPLTTSRFQSDFVRGVILLYIIVKVSAK